MFTCNMNKFWLIIFLILGNIITGTAQQRITQDLSGNGWRLLIDPDKKSWQNEELFLPPVNLKKVLVQAPSGGWDFLNPAKALAVHVPGTVEEYWTRAQGTLTNTIGVSWWFRDVQIPVFKGDKKIRIQFESVQYRAEVFVNQQLIGYNLVAGTPTEVDLSTLVKSGGIAHLAVRVTNPGGVYDWRDFYNIAWGKYLVPGGHAFGGITGRVKLIVSDEVYIDDIYVQNTPQIKTVNAAVTIINNLGKPVKRMLDLNLAGKATPQNVVFWEKPRLIELKPGSNTVYLKINLPTAKIWDLGHPSLYTCKVDLKDGSQIADQDSKTFGFRWFEATGIGKDALFTLNHHRIMVRTSISWGFWPVNGMYPTRALAEKQIRLAKQLGLNMLNFHRCIGQPSVLELADELGLLYYEEPGDYFTGTKDPFARAALSEKLTAMVKRDRSHPSLVIFNMQNEMSTMDTTLLNPQIRDLRKAHQIDPSRLITRTSAWAPYDYSDSQAKIHMRPFDTVVYQNGWFDNHHAPGPPVWLQSFYTDPKNYYNYTADAKEIVYWGEEGAISTPARLEKIKEELSKEARPGWDGEDYLDQFRLCDSFLTAKKLRGTFPTVDAFTTALGKISYDHQGRKIESARINNLTDGYAVNGWESVVIDNHSGIVDIYRNPKADPALISYYNQPFYIAVKLRNQVVDMPGRVVFDLFALNELDQHGSFKLQVTANDPDHHSVFQKDTLIKLTGGTVFGELMANALSFQPDAKAGMYTVEAKLLTMAGKPVATGHDEALAVDWKTMQIQGKGAVLENGNVVKNFLSDNKKYTALPYQDNSPKLDWLLVARSPFAGKEMVLLPNDQLQEASGKKGVTISFFSDLDFNNKITAHTVENINLAVSEGATPDPAVFSTDTYGVRYEGKITAPYTGGYKFELQFAGEAIMLVNGLRVINSGSGDATAEVYLKAGEQAKILIEYKHHTAKAVCRLLWSVPDPTSLDVQKVVDRVKNDGTNLIIIDNAGDWMDMISKRTPITYNGKFPIGINWLGGLMFVKSHPLFKDLPVNQGLNWPYQDVVSNGNERTGLQMAGEELVAGAYHSYPFKLGTSVGVINLGKGKIIFSTLNLSGNLNSKASTASVAKKLLCNYLEFAENK